MRDKEVLRRSYRILALSGIFFVIGISLFLKNVFWGEREKQKEIKYPPLPEIQLNAPSPATVFSTYPDPKEFEHFYYDAKIVTKDNILAFEGSCTDKYYTILVFSSDTDYRIDPSRAKFNQAHLCPESGKFSYVLELKNLGGLEKGEYYVFVADQPAKGLWYNPK